MFGPLYDKVSRSFINSVAGGLTIYLIIDLLVRYKALHNPTSSTDGIAIGMILILSAIIIPVGALITRLFLRLANTNK